jgi:hypothetical protein
MPWSAEQRKAKYRACQEARKNGSTVVCACGCGEMIPAHTATGAPATYKHGHNPAGVETRFAPGQEAWNKGQPSPWVTKAKRGKAHTPEQGAKHAEALRRKYAAEPHPSKGAVRTPAQRARMSEAQRKVARFGPANHFYGRKHADETRIRMGKRGPENSHWRGGAATLPYGPEFTRKFKRLIRDRDGNRCVRCGATREEAGRTLDIHHLDHDKANNDPSNLVTACHACNMWASWNRDRSFV